MKTAEKNPHTNRLAKEKSPYLLQHAHNPVDWYPWGEEAFEKARKENKPIFLSIGYSTCHWCHVMERESFSDPALAEILNGHFVPIKVDREERPDVDSLYMQAVMQMTGKGGWPLSVFLTPDLKPFFGGTYFPPENRWGQPGFKTLLQGIVEAWAHKQEELLRAGDTLVQALQAQEIMQKAGTVKITQDLLKETYQAFLYSYDEKQGGFEPAPKFPRAHALSFLLRYWKGSGETQALKMVQETLQAMAAGGICDHLGGGFHRYSTDAQWLLPHFEKMLYDQALLAKAYLEAYQATREEAYAGVVREIFDYVLREMTGPEGGFYSAEDADSVVDPAHPQEKGEGAFYVWRKEEIEPILGPEQAAIFNTLFGVEADGNVPHDPTGEFHGRNILHETRSLAALAKEFGRPEPEIRGMIADARRKLFEARAKRPRPHRDDKILTDWNGLMISSLAFGSRVLEEPRYREAAEKAAQFILKTLVRKDGRLLHRYRDGETAILGTLEDYAFLIHGLVDLYEATFKPGTLAQAKRLTQEMVRLFWDEKNGGFFLTGSDAQPLLLRQKEVYDGAIPSGNSVAALDLLRVGRLTMDSDLEKKGPLLFDAFSMQLTQHPTAYPQLLMALDFALGPSSEIVIAGAPGASDTQAMVRTVYQSFLPNKVVALHPSGEGSQSAEAPGEVSSNRSQEIEGLIPFLKGQTALEGKATAYVCRNYSCERPATSAEDLKRLLTR